MFCTWSISQVVRVACASCRTLLQEWLLAILSYAFGPRSPAPGDVVRHENKKSEVPSLFASSSRRMARIQINHSRPPG
ncbi:hypothetical protein CCM_09066 [Cordyceps militaris CM01]|uniref:Secreted protein n=1 Tax=Cordyceps militaris (strain CM01) TaxID=983644 RepID=G3JT22_CORMM|nr:uncharacterized protein CCM_09066 [Cordyceps militaris CM01]EGX89018.1 hypothetical protein CCM_09066 [Cordyceps militaris CM01]